MHRLTMVREIGEVKEKVVLRELIAESRLMVRNLSSVGGIRQMVQIPLSLFKQATKKKRLNRFGIGETEGEMQNPPGPSHQDRQP
jgi:hypothetical protein